MNVIEQVAEVVVESTEDPKPNIEQEVVPQEVEKSDAEKQAAREARQKRSDERYRAMEREAQEARREAAFYREAATAQPKEQQEKPVRTDFADDFAYIEALTDFKTAQSAAKVRAELASELEQRSQAKEKQTTAQTFAQREAEFKAEHPDYDDVMQSTTARISPAVARMTERAKDGPALRLYLAQNPDESIRIVEMEPDEQLMEMGLIRDKLKKQPKPITSKAPNPITPTRGAGGKFAKSESDMTGDEFEAHYKQTYRK